MSKMREILFALFPCIEQGSHELMLFVTFSSTMTFLQNLG